MQIETYNAPEDDDICECPKCGTVLQQKLESLTYQGAFFKYRCPKCKTNVKPQNMVIYGKKSY